MTYVLAMPGLLYRSADGLSSFQEGPTYTFKVIHILELLEQLKQQGRIKFNGKTDEPVTFHDPCQIVRRGGVVEPQRDLLNSVAENFVEMTDHGVMNWCCGGGGGVSANERADELRAKAFDRKRRQIEETGVDTVVTACANCRMMLEDGIEENEMETTVIGLTELIADYLVTDAKEQPEVR